ncbi:hypothetical protein EVJ58_g8202 [Rhodofomes roseus]|uniref:Uncharacterized protein n=1 Tax=Rhodofomes roseus TaxID=34475 RepID=A0A4Y9XZL3_9APHY|nr:hypothetical protein EVJ58_g8202 [Rhodofomes roseus]
MFLLAGAALRALRGRYGSQLVGIGRRHLTAVLRGAQYLPLRGYRFILQTLSHRTPGLPPSSEDDRDPSPVSDTPPPPQTDAEARSLAQPDSLETEAESQSLAQPSSLATGAGPLLPAEANESPEVAEPEPNHGVSPRSEEDVISSVSESSTDPLGFPEPAVPLTMERLPQTQLAYPRQLTDTVGPALPDNHGPLAGTTAVTTWLQSEQLRLTVVVCILGFLAYRAHQRTTRRTETPNLRLTNPRVPDGQQPQTQSAADLESPALASQNLICPNFWDAPGTVTDFDTFRYSFEYSDRKGKSKSSTSDDSSALVEKTAVAVPQHSGNAHDATPDIPITVTPTGISTASSGSTPSLPVPTATTASAGPGLMPPVGTAPAPQLPVPMRETADTPDAEFEELANRLCRMEQSDPSRYRWLKSFIPDSDLRAVAPGDEPVGGAAEDADTNAAIFEELRVATMLRRMESSPLWRWRYRVLRGLIARPGSDMSTRARDLDELAGTSTSSRDAAPLARWRHID